MDGMQFHDDIVSSPSHNEIFPPPANAKPDAVLEYLSSYLPSYITSKNELYGLSYRYDEILQRYDKLSNNAAVYVFKGDGKTRDAVYKIHFMVDEKGKTVPALLVRYANGKLEVLANSFDMDFHRTTAPLLTSNADMARLKKQALRRVEPFSCSIAFDMLASSPMPTHGAGAALIVPIPTRPKKVATGYLNSARAEAIEYV